QTNWRAVPAATFTSPEIASVGLTEREAKAEGRTVKIGRFPFRAHGRNIADLETAGFVKLIGDAESGQVLGAHIIGAKASEIIHECSLAIAADLNLRDLAQAIHAHPTVSEAIGEAAEDAEQRRRHGLLLAIADGMGGARGGEVASRLAIETVLRTYREAPGESVAEDLRAAVQAANRRIHRESLTNPDLGGMGTTCTAV